MSCETRFCACFRESSEGFADLTEVPDSVSAGAELEVRSR